MRVNADFSERVVVHPTPAAWVASPQPGVTRLMLDRVGGEVARATSLVRYAAHSTFPAHVHAGGEEILVLEGTFSDEQGDHPTGTYFRNPPGTRHAPRTDEGCLLFVKLWQFAPGDTRAVRIETRRTEWLPGRVDGLAVMPLHEYEGVSTALVRWAPGTRFPAHTHAGGEEILVLAGTFEDEEGSYPAGTWIRNPRYSRHAPFTRDGTLIYVKVGHIGAPTLGEHLAAGVA